MKAIEEAQDKLRRPKREAPDVPYIRRAINELEDAESKLKRAIREYLTKIIDFLKCSLQPEFSFRPE